MEDHSRTVDETDDAVTDNEIGVRFSPLRVDKFIVLSVLTFGLYYLVWLYRNWRYVKESEASSLWPWARALFAPIWYYSLAKRLNLRGKAGLAVGFWILIGLWRLPDPYWLATLLAFLPLLPMLQVINELNSGSLAQCPSYGWRRRSVVVLVLGLLATPLVAIGTFGPATRVVDMDDMKASDLLFLAESGLLEEGEELVHFYSSGLFSIHGGGVFSSDRGITSYWTDPVTEEPLVAFLQYSEILDIQVNYSSHPLEDTSVRVEGAGDAWFIFFLSPEAGGDRMFLEEVDRRRTEATRARRVIA